jgi:hypothetical protein
MRDLQVLPIPPGARLDLCENGATVTPLEGPQLDTRRYDEIVKELMKRIPVYTPEWTEYNRADPGITMLELLALLAPNLLEFEKTHQLTRADGTSETLAEIRKRLEAWLDYMGLERKRIRWAIERIEAVEQQSTDLESQATRAD